MLTLLLLLLLFIIIIIIIITTTTITSSGTREDHKSFNSKSVGVMKDKKCEINDNDDNRKMVLIFHVLSIEYPSLPHCLKLKLKIKELKYPIGIFFAKSMVSSLNSIISAAFHHEIELDCEPFVARKDYDGVLTESSKFFSSQTSLLLLNVLICKYKTTQQIDPNLHQVHTTICLLIKPDTHSTSRPPSM